MFNLTCSLYSSPLTYCPPWTGGRFGPTLPWLWLPMLPMLWLPWYPGFTPWSGRGGYAPPEIIYWINLIMQNKLWPAASWDLSYEGGCTDMIQKDVSKNDKWSQSILIIFCLCGFQICFIVTLIVHCTDKNILFLLWHLYTYTLIHYCHEWV